MTVDLPSTNTDLWKPNRVLNRRIETSVKVLFGAFAFVSVATTIGIVFTLIFETFEFFLDDFFHEKLAEQLGRPVEGFWGEVQTFLYSLKHFLTDTKWTPLFSSAQFGIFVLISATVMTSGIAVLVALPLGLLSAICLSEYATLRTRSILKPILEILAGVPTVVYGYFALLFVTPLLQNFIPVQGFNALSAGIVLGIMITPMVASLSEDAIFAVPRSLRDGAYALGATKRETIISVVLPAALSGIVSSLILAISRAIGETMIVTLAAGQNPRLGFNPTVPVMTMTAFIVQVSLGDTPAGSLAYKTIYAVGMTLFLITLVLNIFSFWFVRRFREKYE
ncbi:phosphate ABC transporter permease [Leptolyngbya valderiana BDU 20041]|nr:phosphate ABC transporter permease subunit PstC [Geitlerinema sp. CS-897]OAB61535.1 phosphate ABC transporter permease [Leptolyngbya valderiana BDU 20041]